jgi:flagellar biosynthesis protein FlhG
MDDQDHYEVLEVSRSAGSVEIERAYRLVSAAYADGSLAIYSIFGSEEAVHIRQRIEEAYRVLSNPETRRAYDDEMGLSSDYEAGEVVERRENVGLDVPLVPDLDEERAARIGAISPELPTTIDVFEDLEAEVEEGEQDFDGATLRRARLRRGVELDQISEVTKVGNRYLTCLEEERFDDLPASVYIRGFVAAYARAIGLEPEGVAASYMQRVEEARSTKPRTGLLGRK